MKKQDFKNQKN